MERYEFKFIVTDAKLSKEHEEKVGRAIAEAGALALAGLTPPNAVNVRFGPHQWWFGIPPLEISKALEQVAIKAAGGEIR